MHLIYFSEQYIQIINEMSFLLALLLVAVFYMEYKRCEEEIEREEMLENFLNEK